MQVLGVDIAESPRQEIYAEIKKALTGSRYVRVATVGPEFLVRGEKDVRFRTVLADADLRTIDSVGLLSYMQMSGVNSAERYTGVDIFHDLCAYAEKEELHIFLALKKGGLSTYAEVERSLKDLYPVLRVSGSDCKVTEEVTGDMYALIGDAQIIFCNFGAPEQEYFLESVRRVTMQNAESKACLGVGIGGTLDYLTGHAKRAPAWMRDIGLEWFYRFVTQPHRAMRIVRAVIIFPLLILKEKFFMNVVVYMATSVNGMIAAESHDVSFVSDASFENYEKLIADYDCIVIGRKTHDVMPANEFDATKNYLVLSHGSHEKKVGNTYDIDSPQEALDVAKTKGWKSILITGGGSTVTSFLQAGFVDGIILDVMPTMFAGGISLIQESASVNLELVDAKPFGDGAVQLYYKVKK